MKLQTGGVLVGTPTCTHVRKQRRERARFCQGVPLHAVEDSQVALDIGAAKELYLRI